MLSDTDVENNYNPSVRLLEVERHGSTGCGFHLTRGKWDPYPWVVDVDGGSPADLAGMHPGDCLLEVNGEDIVGLRITEVAELVKSRSNQVSLLLWNAGIDPQCSPEALCCGPMPKNLQRLSVCMTSILTFLECPVCLDTIHPPAYQCDNGHLICMRCRAKSERCPVCRQRLSRGRSLLADQVRKQNVKVAQKVYNALTEAFDLRDDSEETRTAKMQQIFKLRNKNRNVPDIKVTQSHTNKFLARIIGKSSSVDNLTAKTSTPANLLVQNEFNLKMKSLSSNEIFSSVSPIVSRQSSMGRLTPQRRILSDENRPASYHGSFESLENKNIDDLNIHRNGFLSTTAQLQESNGLLYHCPYSSTCSLLIKGNEIKEHFKTSHDGPLVQYFKPKFKLSFSALTEDVYYMINVFDGMFFVRISPCKDNEEQTTIFPDTLLWMWHVGNKNASAKYQMQVNICKEDAPSKIILSVRSEVFSLNSISFQEIKETKKGIYLGAQTIETFGSNVDSIILEIEIVEPFSQL